MDLGSIFLILALTILVGLFVARPFFEHRGSIAGQVEHERSALMAERDRILNALQELDFDHALGKIPEEDYPAQRAALLKRGAEILKQLDAYQQDGDTRLRTLVEGEDVQFSSNKKAAPSAVDDPLETLIAQRRRQRASKAIGFCPKCGGAIYQGDRFCSKCGTPVL